MNELKEKLDELIGKWGKKTESFFHPAHFYQDLKLLKKLIPDEECGGFTVPDVIYKGVEEGYILTQHQAEEIFKRMQKGFNANHGMSWEDIGGYIEEFTTTTEGELIRQEARCKLILKQGYEVGDDLEEYLMKVPPYRVWEIQGNTGRYYEIAFPAMIYASFDEKRILAGVQKVPPFFIYVYPVTSANFNEIKFSDLPEACQEMLKEKYPEARVVR
jgi:hypothetical protein